jgi:hypothetical protein
VFGSPSRSSSSVSLPNQVSAGSTTRIGAAVSSWTAKGTVVERLAVRRLST